MLSKLFSKRAEPSAPTFEPNAQFCIGALEILANSLVDKHSFRSAFDGIQGWHITPEPGGSLRVLNRNQMISGLLDDNVCTLIFGHASEVFVELMVVDMWVKMRDFSYSGFERVQSNPYRAKAFLPLGDRSQLDFLVATPANAEPFAGAQLSVRRTQLSPAGARPQIH